MAGKGSSKSKRKLIVLGVAILVIVIFIFLLRTFTFTTQMLSGPCTAFAGYYCANPFLNITTGNLTLDWGQNTGINWNNTYIRFVLSGTQLNNSGIPEVSFSKPNATYLTFVKSGNITTINISVNKPNTLRNNQQVTGSIWVKYIINSKNQTSYFEVAKIKITTT